MSRPLRILYPGAWYHVMNRGRRREEIFACEEDFHCFLDLMTESIEMWGIRVSAYCLMQNHYHILMQTPLANLPRAMRHIDGVYTQKYNWRHGGDGQLFRGRYKSILVDSNSYLCEVVKYIHNNPRKAGVVASIGEYRWTSHHAYLSAARKWSWLHREPVLAMIAGRGKDRRKAYLEFVEQKLDKEVEAFYSMEHIKAVLGRSRFVQSIKDSLSDTFEHAEFPSKDIEKARVDDVMRAVCAAYGMEPAELKVPRRGSPIEARQAFAYLARKKAGMTLASIADLLGLGRHSSACSIVSRLEAELRGDSRKRERILGIERAIMRQA